MADTYIPNRYPNTEANISDPMNPIIKKSIESLSRFYAYSFSGSKCSFKVLTKSSNNPFSIYFL